VTDGPVLGYAGALYNHLEDVRSLRGWLCPLLERHDLHVIHVGAHPSLPTFAEVAGVEPRRVEVRDGRPWREYAASHPCAGMDIGIVPLVARPFNQAKSALKGMEYAACGVPFVASRSPEYQWLGTGTLVGNSFEDQGPDAWIDAIEQLLDPNVRATLAQQQSARIAARILRCVGPIGKGCIENWPRRGTRVDDHSVDELLGRDPACGSLAF